MDLPAPTGRKTDKHAGPRALLSVTLPFQAGKTIFPLFQPGRERWGQYTRTHTGTHTQAHTGALTSPVTGACLLTSTSLPSSPGLSPVPPSTSGSHLCLNVHNVVAEGSPLPGRRGDGAGGGGRGGGGRGGGGADQARAGGVAIEREEK